MYQTDHTYQVNNATYALFKVDIVSGLRPLKALIHGQAFFSMPDVSPLEYLLEQFSHGLVRFPGDNKPIVLVPAYEWNDIGSKNIIGKRIHFTPDGPRLDRDYCIAEFSDCYVILEQTLAPEAWKIPPLPVS